MDRKTRGRLGMTMAINYFTSQGYTISIPLNDTQWYDLIIEKDGKFETVQCKATGTDDNRISLRSSGGTNGGVYDRVTNHTELDYLFCIDKDLVMWNIPMKDLLEAGNTNSIALRKEETVQGFQTYKYLVNLGG